MSAVDLFTTYQFIKRLVTPFNKWKAYSLGIIDEHGHQLKVREELKSTAERDAFGYLDILALNLRKLLAKIPGGDKTLATYAAALLLLKEYPKVQKEDVELLENIEEIFEGYLAEVEMQYEEVPVNSASNGQVASIGVGPKGEPPAGCKSRYKKENEKYSNEISGTLSSILKRNSP